MKCKDIPDRPILEFLAVQDSWASWINPTEFGDAIDDPTWMPYVGRAMPPGVPAKLRIAKMAKLIRRGLVDGCDCGCRGDYELSEQGEKFLEKVHIEEATELIERVRAGR